MKRAVPAGMLAALILMAQAPGIHPRADANSYPVHEERADLSIGAALMPPEQVKKTFAANLSHAGYVVVEVGVFPGTGRDVDLFPADFTLWAGAGGTAMRPVDADTIAEIMTGSHDRQQTRSTAPGGINTSTGVSVGRVSYPDPVTGRRTSGTVTETSTGVGVGGPAPMPCRTGYDCDAPMPAPPASQTSPIQREHAIAQELWSKSLPDGKTPRAVAGYLYFPKPPAKSKNSVWELRYEPASSDRISLTLPR